MKKCYRYFLVILPLVVLSAALLASGLLHNKKMALDQYTSVDRLPEIWPDYFGTVIPPNIAPLNFLVREKGSHYYVKIYSTRGEPIEVLGRSPKIIIPQQLWRSLLNLNRTEHLYVDVYVKTARGEWNRFSTIKNKIANENIDPFLVYRKIHPGHNMWRKMGIYQRNLENFDESPVLTNEYFKRGCLNCHTFYNHSADKMLIGIRSADYGSSAVLVADGVVKKIGTKFGYTSWHPSGRLAAYAISYVGQFFHTARTEVRDVIELDSALACYKVESKTVETSPNISRKDHLETYPMWSPDGRYLYFCSAPLWWDGSKAELPEHYDQIRYDLLRVSYDLKHNQWGQLETVLAAEDTGLSIIEPRISPDGRWLLFCMCNYGCFPVYQQSSDLYLMDLEAAVQTGRYDYRKLHINSDKSESWHSWSSNSRWIVFSSKRDYGVFTRSYFSYVDQASKVYKPILLPQKDPTFYDSCITTYSVPELVTGPVRLRQEKLGRVIRSSRQITVDMPITMATPKAGQLPDHQETWQQRE